ncbi:dienelactone hydrolase [Asticcacaulis sp.]|uniref:dienelactone hydrolase n=1 Tax=Asticcacaulis sp. TaxID=1872648 RepID=UPI0031E43AA5
MRPHIYHYAEAAAAVGVRAYVVDSLKARGWGRSHGVTLVCTGLALQGYERSGDVLAAIKGISALSEVRSDQIVLSGWSHGGWSIMDLMTEPLKRPGEARLADPDPALIDHVRGLFLVYPYISFPARSLRHPWIYRPRTRVALARKDHLTAYARAISVLDRLRADGLPVDMLSFDATHAYDEQNFGGIGPMHHDQAAMDGTTEGLTSFLREVFNMDLPSQAVAAG